MRNLVILSMVVFTAIAATSRAAEQPMSKKVPPKVIGKVSPPSPEKVAGHAPEQVTEKELTEKLRFYASINILDVSFTQTKVLKELDVRLSSEGHLKIIRPDKIVWQITKPSPVRVTLDKKEIRIETGSGASLDTQVVKLGDNLPDKAAKSLTGLIAWLNLDAANLYKQYTIFRFGNGFRFDPRDPANTPFRELKMTLGTDGHLKHLSILEVSGDTLDIAFQKPKLTSAQP